VADRLVVASRLGERDRHVLEDAGIVGVIAQRETIRRKGRVVVSLPLQRERLIQVVETLRAEVVRGRAAEERRQKPMGRK